MAKTINAEKIVNDTVHRLTLGLFSTGCDKKNFEILTSLPLTAAQIEKMLKMTPGPVNGRIKKLKKCGLLRRDGHMLRITDHGKSFLALIKKVEKDVKKEMSRMV